MLNDEDKAALRGHSFYPDKKAYIDRTAQAWLTQIEDALKNPLIPDKPNSVRAQGYVEGMQAALRMFKRFAANCEVAPVAEENPFTE